MQFVGEISDFGGQTLFCRIKQHLIIEDIVCQRPIHDLIAGVCVPVDVLRALLLNEIGLLDAAFMFGLAVI